MPNTPNFPGMTHDGIGDSKGIPAHFSESYNERLSVAPPPTLFNEQTVELMSKYPMFTSKMFEHENIMGNQAVISEGTPTNIISKPAEMDMSEAPAAVATTLDSQKTAQLAEGGSIKGNAALSSTGGTPYSQVQASPNALGSEVETRAGPLALETPKLAPKAGVPGIPVEETPNLAGGEIGTGFVGTDAYGTSGDTSSGRTGAGFATAVQA